MVLYMWKSDSVVFRFHFTVYRQSSISQTSTK